MKKKLDHMAIVDIVTYTICKIVTATPLAITTKYENYYGIHTNPIYFIYIYC